MTDVSNDEDPVSDEFAELTVHVSEKTGKPIIMAHHWTHLRGRQILARIGAKGVLSIEGTETLFLAIRHAFAHRDFRALPPFALPPGPAPAILARWRQRLAKPEALDEAESLALLADFGIANPGFEIAQSTSEAVAAAERLGLPVALKTAMPGIHHKSEVEGVRLGLATAGEVALAYEALARRLGPRVIVAAMAKPGIELALAIARFSLLATSLGDLIGELDVNPLIAGADGVVAVDALVLPRAAAKES